MDYGKIEDTKVTVKILSPGTLKDNFIPWKKGERGRQSFVKLSKKDESAYLYAGAGSIMQAEIQKTLMRLVNDGWSVEGDLSISFDGAPDIASDRLLCRHEITVEIGLALLPLVDPYQGAPLFEKLNLIREDLAEKLGFLLPGINVRDNMDLPHNSYVIKLRESPKGSGDIYIDRLLAIGSSENLAKIAGWSVIEPTYRMNAKWIEAKDRELAEQSGCMVQGPLNVILTHIANIISNNSSSVLGLQEVYNLLSDLAPTHPVLVDEFISNIKELRKVRKILHGLLNEQVSLKDLITIMEVIGEHSDELSNTDQMIAHVRSALAPQICWSLVDADGYMRIVTFAKELEKQLKSHITDALGGAYLLLSEEQETLLLSNIREFILQNELMPVLVTDPAIRLHIARLLEQNNITLKVLATTEITQDIKVIPTGEIKASIIREEKKSTARKKGDASFWTKKLGKTDK